jgi:ribosomal protein L22
MAKIHKYGVRELRADFPNDEKCVEYIFNALHSKKCSCGGEYKPLKGRRQYQCSKCRFQIAPTAGTIFHKSDTPLSLWFEAIFRFSNAKSGFSAKQLERDLNVTYKTAWRILRLIRKALAKENKGYLQGSVEMDEAYFGGKGEGGKYNQFHKEAMENKTPIIGAVEREGKLIAKVVKNIKAETIAKFLDQNIDPMDTRLMTDNSNRYNNAAWGYDRQTVTHSKKEFVRGDIHVNNIESFWAHFKRSAKGTHKVISRKFLQSYLDGFVFHYNNRRNDRERFSSLLGALLPVVK